MSRPCWTGETTLMVWFWENLINFLYRISLFNLIQTLIINKLNWPQQKKYLFVDLWVMGHTLLSIVAILVVRYGSSSILKYILLYYGIWRTFEIFIYQIKITIIDAYKQNAQVSSYRRSVLSLIHNFMEIIFWFTASYLLLMNWFDVADRKFSLIQAFYMSFVTMTTFGSPNFNITNSPAMILIMLQSVTGLLLTLISLARFISLLKMPKSNDSTESS
ncbi:ion channel [Paenibacillus sp. Leaf72]|uniref:ion channel n=1 Tax=Paenibacillus sp. Leaf72 TaxID=1736234 RepID=UPI0006FDD1D3|nr:ion channel [Paenibacillus sp. Leaf72]KQO11001.1 hypothetical protein ASF12_11555 [Paenibacillus sp. Leaf72]